jgi:hypothetical protein
MQASLRMRCPNCSGQLADRALARGEELSAVKVDGVWVVPPRGDDSHDGASRKRNERVDAPRSERR